MHYYSTNHNNKIKIAFVLSAASMVLIFIIKDILALSEKHTVNLTSTSAFTIFTILYFLFDKYIWKYKPVATIGLIKTPIINGKWTGKLKSSGDDFKKEWPINITIHQTWEKISICLDGETKESESTMASIRIINPSKSELEWAFISRDKPQYSNGNSMSYGCAKLSLEITSNNNVSDTIKGSYFMENKVDTYGEIMLEKVKEDD